MTKSSSHQVLTETWPVFLDFDGPVTYLFVEGRNQAIADRMLDQLDGRSTTEIPPPTTHDPLIVLRWVYEHCDPRTYAAVELASIRGEVEATTVTEPTPGSDAFIRACHLAGRPLVILSNNAPEAIHAYLARFDLASHVTAVIGRVHGDPNLMKPNPHLVDQALSVVNETAHRVAFIGDSVTDVHVGNATGLRTIGYAKTPQRGSELDMAGAESLTASMDELANIVKVASAIAH